MDYISTRGSAPALDFAGATLAGLASDGGLYVPREWPRFSEDEIAAMAGLPYAELAARVMQPFVGDSLTPERLLELTTQAYGRFAHKAVTPLKQLDEQHWLLELFHGPTLAFKDVALQLLGLLFEEFLRRLRAIPGRQRSMPWRAAPGSRFSCSTPRAGSAKCSAGR
jgi:threonine synthase